MAREAACFHSFAFRRCDYKNLGVSFLCNFEEQIQGQQIQPPIWGQNVLKQYLDEINEVPEYLESLARNSNKRLFADESGNQIFAAANVEVDETGEKIPKSVFIRHSVLLSFRISEVPRALFLAIRGSFGLCKR